MTEKTANTKQREAYAIDPVAFFFALIGAPLAVAAGGFWIMGIPVIAAVLGGPFYLAIGVPVLLWHLGRHPPRPWRIAELAFTSSAVMSLVGLTMIYITEGARDAQHYLFFVGFALIFAPLWGGVFGIFYRNFQREIYTHPVEI